MYGCAADRTRFAKPAMDGHARPKSGDLLRKAVAGFGSESRDPFLENVARGVVESLRIVVREFLCQGEWRKTARWRISSEYALPIPLNKRGSVRDLLSVWFCRRRTA